MGIYRLTKSLEKDAYLVLNPKGENLVTFLNEINGNSEYENLILEPQAAISE